MNAKRQIMVDYRVHVTHNNVFRFAHVPRTRFIVLHKKLQLHAKQIGTSKSSIPSLDRRCNSGKLSREDLDEEIEKLQKILSLAIETFGYNHKNMTVFFGRKICSLLSLGDVSPLVKRRKSNKK